MLTQPYPFSEVTPRSMRGAILAGIFVAFFLLFFQPFGLSQWMDPYKWLKVSGYGAVTSIVLSIDFYLIKKPWKAVFDEKKWTVWKEIAWTVFILMSVTVGNHLYTQFLFAGKMSSGAFWNILLATFSIGLFPTTAFILTNYIIQLRKYTHPVTVLHPLPEEVSPAQLELVAENGRDRLVFLPTDLLCIESCDNYATVYLLDSQQIRKELIRSSLTRLESQLSHPEIIRCHRSYIVNLMQVERVSGNAQGYKLHLKNMSTPVPVARKYTATIVERV